MTSEMAMSNPKIFFMEYLSFLADAALRNGAFLAFGVFYTRNTCNSSNRRAGRLIYEAMAASPVRPILRTMISGIISSSTMET